jgi:hypothetical protein
MDTSHSGRGSYQREFVQKALVEPDAVQIDASGQFIRQIGEEIVSQPQFTKALELPHGWGQALEHRSIPEIARTDVETASSWLSGQAKEKG